MKLATFIICDDIRKEIGNKNSLMGIYDDTIEFLVTPNQKNTWPRTMRLGFFARITYDENEEKSLYKFRLKSLFNEKDTIIGEGNLNIIASNEKKKINIAIIHNNFHIENEGIYNFSIEFIDHDENIINILEPDFSMKIYEREIS